MNKSTKIGLGLLAAAIAVPVVFSSNGSAAGLFSGNTTLYNKALAATQRLTGTLNSTQIASLKAIVAANAIYNPSDNGSQLAYIIATAWHESRLKPVRECFATSDNAARACVASRNYGFVENGHVYYGRGFVQITHGDNYKRLGDALGHDLYNNPDLALRPDVAAAILVYGMVNGSFTGRKLDHYISNTGTNDYYQARRIVNGLDKAQLINDYAITIATA